MKCDCCSWQTKLRYAIVCDNFMILVCVTCSEHLKKRRKKSVDCSDCYNFLRDSNTASMILTLYLIQACLLKDLCLLQACMNLLFLVGQAAWIPETKPPPDSGPAAVRIWSEKYNHHPRRTSKNDFDGVFVRFQLSIRLYASFKFPKWWLGKCTVLIFHLNF